MGENNERKLLKKKNKPSNLYFGQKADSEEDLEDLDEDEVDRERQVLIDQAVASGKPKEIAEKMVNGRMLKYFQEVVLNEQVSVIDGETKIKDVVTKLQKDLDSEVKLAGFIFLKLGEGIEISENDFAAEVAATAGIK